MTLIECATTSWSSRAIRARSSTIAAAALSFSFSSSRSFRRRCRTARPAAHGAPRRSDEKTTVVGGDAAAAGDNREVEANGHPTCDQRAAAARVRGSTVDGEQQEHEQARAGSGSERRHRKRRNGDGEDQAEQRERVTGPSRRCHPKGDRERGGSDPMPVRSFAQRDLEQHDRGERGSQHLVAAPPNEVDQLVPTHRLHATPWAFPIPSVVRATRRPEISLSRASQVQQRGRRHVRDRLLASSRARPTARA